MNPLRVFRLISDSRIATRVRAALAALLELAQHEMAFLDQHALAVRERWQVARRTRNPGELLRHQIDLLPATKARLQQNHRHRLQLLRGLANNFSRPT